MQKRITADDYTAAIAVPVEPAIQEPSTGCQTAGGSAYFCDYVTQLLKTDPLLALAQFRIEASTAL